MSIGNVNSLWPLELDDLSGDKADAHPLGGFAIDGYNGMLDGADLGGPRPRTVLMTADTVGGVWTYALELARALGRHHCHVALATMGALPSADQAREAAKIANLTLYPSAYRLEWMDAPWADVDAAGQWLLELERQLQPDVVHLNQFSHGVLPWSAPTLMVGHSCVFSWWQAVKGELPPAEWSQYRRRVTLGLRNANLVIAPTYAMLRALDQNYGPIAEAKVIANGRTPGDFAPAPRKESFILTVGRLWDEAKNIGALDTAAEEIHWPIYVAGEQRHPSGGEQNLPRLHPLGRLPASEVAAWMGRARIYALPARYEPFGLSPVEAALSGCALVLGDIPSLREVWGNTALYVPPNDAQALAATLKELIHKPLRRTSLAAMAQRRAHRFTPAKMGVAYWYAYCGLMARQSRPKVRMNQAVAA